MMCCNNCGALFENPLIVRDYHDELDDRAYEELQCCPSCKSDDLSIAVQCSFCGEYVIENYIVLPDGTIACDGCYVMY